MTDLSNTTAEATALEADDEAVVPAIIIQDLYKIFGPHPDRHIDAVKKGMTKSDLNRKHGHSLGLKAIDTELPAGSISVIMGLSGSGKSTLLRHINGLIAPTAGQVLIDGQDVAKMSETELRTFRRHKTAMVFQKFGLLPHRTVLENTLYGLDIQGISRKESEPVGRRWIERVGLKGYEDQYPTQLSGGMQQRVGLARALANDAPVLLMDEAFSALDPLIRVDMQSVLLELQQELRKTIVFITHDLDEALRLGDKIVVLRAGEISQQGTGQDIVLNPANDYIRAFVREVNRARVIQLRAITRPHKPDTSWPSLTLSGSMTLEEAAKQLTSSDIREATVLSRQGRPRGVVDLMDVTRNMLRAE